jgi:steroid delta-isomerase-like uncharacterized protein
MSIESSKAVMDQYFGPEHSTDVLADDVVFTVMGTGVEHHGPEAVGKMLAYFYSVAFDATAEMKNLIYGENGATAEFDLVGKHIGEFAGIPATGKDVRIPLCVNYDLENNQIKRARIYMEMPVLMRQLGIQMG